MDVKPSFDLESGPSGPARATRDIAWLLLCLGLWFLGIAGCAPAELEPLPDAGAASADVALSDSELNPDAAGDGSSTTDATSGATDFPQVAQTLAAGCGEAFCHGENHNGNFHIDGGTEASVDAVRLALEDVDSLAGTPLVAAGDPSGSAIYQRIIGQGNQMPPPPGSPLAQEKIDMIHDWIAQGALYE